MDKGLFKRIRDRVAAGYPFLWVVTSEEARVDRVLEKVYRDLGGGSKAKRASKVVAWSHADGWDPQWPKGKEKEAKEAGDLWEALTMALRADEGLMLVLRDPHALLLDTWGEKAARVRRLVRNCCRFFPGQKKTLVVVTPVDRVPTDLEREATIIRVPLPGREEIGSVLDGVAATNRLDDLMGEERTAAVAAARGLTLPEVENAFALSLRQTGKFDPVVIGREKAEVVNRSPALKLLDPSDLPLVGGYGHLKRWLEGRKAMLSPAAREWNLPSPKGMVLIGPPGTGKGLIAKDLARRWMLPLVQFEAGLTQSALVGSSEAGMRLALDLADATSPSILLLDEIEKMFAGVQGSLAGHDTGVKAGIFGSFLTWLQDRRGAVFVVATMNSVQGVPPELLRKGRFDEFWMVDLPGLDDREAILQIHLERIGQKLSPLEVRVVAEKTRGFSGAELEALVVEGTVLAFEDRQPLLKRHLDTVILDTKPLSAVMKEEIHDLREWARGRTRMAGAETDAETPF